MVEQARTLVLVRGVGDVGSAMAGVLFAAATKARRCGSRRVRRFDGRRKCSSFCSGFFKG
jgi:hypothetical protein